jgi:hypothetical protein
MYKLIETIKRDVHVSMEAERARVNAHLFESKESTLLIANERIERAKEELLSRVKDIERVIALF